MLKNIYIVLIIILTIKSVVAYIIDIVIRNRYAKKTPIKILTR